VETVLHELAHNHLFLPGQGRFNESYANFAGHVGAIAFFCTRAGGGPDTTWCRRARDRWDDARELSSWLDRVEAEVREVYARSGLEGNALVARRDAVYREAHQDFVNRVQPGFRASTYGWLAAEPMNNVTLLSRTLYYHRLDDFHTLWLEAGAEEDPAGATARVMARLRSEAREHGDPFALLPGMP
jgi:predicted aminopeptidase